MVVEMEALSTFEGSLVTAGIEINENDLDLTSPYFDDTLSMADPLSLLRQSIASFSLPLPTLDNVPTDDLALATHLQFTSPLETKYSLSTPTRFASSNGTAVDLRSIYFAWKHKDDPIPEYIASAEALNNSIAAGGKVQNLAFVERLDLITWLEGASDDSEYIKPLEGEAIGIQTSSQAASQALGAGAGSQVASRHARTIDPRVQEILKNERRMGDRNSVLHGIKPTDFSHVRKIAENYLRAARHANKPGAPATNPLGTHPSNPLVSLPKSKPSRRPDPIILLSPSASSLLRMSNIKSFLSDGAYIPPDSNSASATTNILHISRPLPTIDSNRPLRFILVDSTEQFKPDYWSRVVAVFTTGQAWQFKSYKWQTPQELFNHVLGVYIGWRDDAMPETVKSWGRAVACVSVEKWRGEGVGRYRDREVVEGLWSRIEENMRKSGWGAGGPEGR